MAKLFVNEFPDRGYVIDVPEMPPSASQVVAIGGASVQSTAFAKATQLVGITTDSICSVAVGANPTATVDVWRLAAGATMYFTVPVGKSFKVAVIANT